MVATGGVYKGQGRSRRRVMTRAYWEFLVHGAQLQAPIPVGGETVRFPDAVRAGKLNRAASPIVARVRPRTSKGITDLLSLTFVRLFTARPSKKPVSGVAAAHARPTARGRAPDEPDPPDATAGRTRAG